METMRRLGRLAVRWRYAVLLVWGAGWFVAAYATRPTGILTDWLWFEFSARTLIHLNSHYSTGALGIYAHNPEVQIGPPPIVLVAAFQWLAPATVRLLFTSLMGLAGLWCVRCVERIADRQSVVDRRASLPTVVLLAGLVLMPIWAWEAARWAHLDDVMAITGTLTAMAIIATGRRWWLAAVILGIAVASKPWALITTPCLLGLPRVDRARATLVTIAVAGACWLPFVLGDPATVHALGSFEFPVDAGSTMHFLGMPLGNAPKWVRPVQFIGGLAVCVAAVRRRRWLAVPLIGFGFRVVSDPQMWLYYGIGPLVGAAVWDAGTGRRWPLWTAVTALVEFAVPTISPPWSGPVRLVWFVVVAVAVLRPNRAEASERSDSTVGQASVPLAA
jgi:hypothetical protein